MASPVQPSFQLKVLREGDGCFFKLNSPDGDEILTTVPYEPSLDELHYHWRTLYQARYNFRFRGKARGQGGGGRSAWLDYGQDLQIAENHLIDTFNRWLGQAKLQPMRDQLQQAIYTASQAVLPPRSRPQQHWGNGSVHLSIACDTPSLTQLPWEAWQLLPNGVASADAPSRSPQQILSISRSVIASHSGLPFPVSTPRVGKPRILCILAEAPELDTEVDVAALQVLNSVAVIKVLRCRTQADLPEPQAVDRMKQQVEETIADERGWTGIFFVGHSDESPTTGGLLQFAPRVLLSVDELTAPLQSACQRGLKFAVFNSCSGLNIAARLLNLGLRQVVVMRERVHDEVAHLLMQELCRKLAARQDIQTAFSAAVQNLESRRVTYPSAHLVPAFFRHPADDEALFRIEPFRLQKLWQQWRPNRREAIALGITTLLLAAVPIREGLLDQRYWFQAVYRQLTRQPSPVPAADVTLIEIDQESLSRAGIDTYKVEVMSREYLAQLVTHLQTFEPSVVGFTYYLDGSTEDDGRLKDAIAQSIARNDTQFVFLSMEDPNGQRVRVSPTVADFQVAIEGDSLLWGWQLMTPEEETCASLCPFAYQVANTYWSQQPASQDQPHLRTPSRAIAHGNPFPVQIQPIIDLSIRPEQAYGTISAQEFLERTSDDERSPAIRNQIVLITAGGYDRAQNNFPSPLAFRYWLWQSERDDPNRPPPNRAFTGGDIYGYMIYQWLAQHMLWRIPQLWIILLAAVLGKGLSLAMQTQSSQERRRWLLVGLGAPVVYGLISLQLYIWPGILLPWLLPSVLFWSYLPSASRGR